MTKTIARIWDPAEHLQSDEDMAAYLEAALEEGDAALFAAALGDIARAKGMSQLARETGLGRESLNKALSPSGNPEFATILRVVGALGLQLHATLPPSRATANLLGELPVVRKRYLHSSVMTSAVLDRCRQAAGCIAERDRGTD